MVLAHVSIGEVLDKISILQIKLEHIHDEDKLVNIRHELALLQDIPEIRGVDITQLYRVNLKLWKVEDQLRELEKVYDFGDGFVQLARSVYKLNDERARIKKDINVATSSEVVEEKSYK